MAIVCVMVVMVLLASATTAVALTGTRITGIPAEKYYYRGVEYSTQDAYGAPMTGARAKVTYSGRVVNAGTGKPIPGIKVRVYRLGGESISAPVAVATKTTDRYGRFSFSEYRVSNTEYTFRSLRNTRYASSSKKGLSLISPHTPCPQYSEYL